MQPKIHTTQHYTPHQVTLTKGLHADAAGAPEEQGQPTRKVEVEQGQQGDENAEGQQCWVRQGARGEREGRRTRRAVGARRQARKLSGNC